MNTKKRAIFIALMVALLATILPLAVSANWCGPNAGTRACLECPLGVNSECNNTTCFTDMPAACLNFTPVTQVIPGSFQAYSCAKQGRLPLVGTLTYADAVANASSHKQADSLCPPAVAKSGKGWIVQLYKVVQ